MQYHKLNNKQLTSFGQQHNKTVAHATKSPARNLNSFKKTKSVRRLKAQIYRIRDAQ
jgi:hypothetical protein